MIVFEVNGCPFFDMGVFALQCLKPIILLDWKVDVDAAVDVVSEDCGFGSEDWMHHEIQNEQAKSVYGECIM